jgi:hypothetical protein
MLVVLRAVNVWGSALFCEVGKVICGMWELEMDIGNVCCYVVLLVNKILGLGARNAELELAARMARCWGAGIVSMVVLCCIFGRSGRSENMLSVRG